MTATRTAAEVIELIRDQRPDADPVAAEHDDMAKFCNGEPWYVWFGSTESTPERIVLPIND